jgi:16S rRNA (guanine(966)-N(2))-methyltransferase RsmD
VPNGVRATTDRVREAIFSILEDASDKTVLDLYAGSGSLGIEALSRGARTVWFVDVSKKSLNAVRANLENKGGGLDIRLIRKDAVSFLPKIRRSFDWVFCDPPFYTVDLQKLVSAFAASEAVGGETLIILEIDRFHTLPVPDELTLIDRRKFGDSIVHFIKRVTPDDAEPSRA